MHANLSGRKHFIGRSIAALVCGVVVGAGAWFILETYFPDISPYWATALGATVAVLMAPFATTRGGTRKE